MFLDIQNQLRESVQIEPGYAEAYADWSTENKDVLYKWSPEERTQRFSKYLEGKTEQDLLKLIDTSALAEYKKKELKSLTKRGQLLLVSTDGGKNFDKFLTPETAKNAVPTSYQILSPTFRSSTTDLSEVIAEQTLVHTVSTFQDQALWGQQVWLVQNAYLDKGIVHLDVVHYRYGAYQVEVDPDQAAGAPLAYTFINEKGKETVPETQLPEEYGEAKPDVNLQPRTQEELINQQMVAAHTGDSDAANAAMGAGLAMLAAQEAASHASADQRAKEAAMFAKTSMNQPLTGQAGGVLVPNVTAAKAAMAARFARQAQALQAAQKHEMERIKKHKEMQGMVNKQTKNAQKAKQAGLSASQKNIAKGMGATAGIAGAAAGVLTGSTLFVTLLS